MADIRHWIRVDAPPERVYEALTTRDGLTRWWTADVEAEPKEGSVARFGFGNRSVVFRMRIEKLRPPALVRWRCEGDFEKWKDTML